MSAQFRLLLPENIDFDGPFPRLSRRLRLGIVGGGRISITQAQAARLSDYWEITAGALSSNPVRSIERGVERFIPPDRCYDSFDDMAVQESQRTDGIDAVMITTPNHLHRDASIAFLKAGIDVFCDKPLTNTSEYAHELVAIAIRSGLVFGVSNVMASFVMTRQARLIVQSGGIGKINQIHVEFMQDWMIPDDMANAEHVKWRLDPAKSGATSCTADIGVHAQHLASFVSGLSLSHVRAEMFVCGSPKPLEDTVMMMTRYKGDVPGTLLATRLAAGNRGGLRLRIYGSEGSVEWDLEQSDYLRHCRYGEPDRILSRGHGHGIHASVERLVRTGRGFGEGIIEAWANLYTNYALAVAARRDCVNIPAGWLVYPTVEDGAEGVRFIEAVVASNKNGGQWTALH
jgi:predicted dehydrogenase